MTRSGQSKLDSWMVSPRARVFDRGEETFVLGADGIAHKLSGDSAELVRALLALLVRPRARDELLAEVAALAGEPIERPEVIDDALALLQASGAVERAVAAAPPPARGRLVLGISGAVAAASTPELVGRLLGAGFEVRVAMTQAARRFVTPTALEAIAHARVYRGLWQRDESCPVPHINLAEWADLVLVCPASATTISRIAGGDCSDLVAAIVAATRAPVLVVPSMNAAMSEAESIARNLSRLRTDGRYVVRAGLGEEVAHRPAERAPAAGAIPSFAAVVEIACFLAAERARLDWDALYAACEGPPPFCAERFDPDFGEALASRRPTGGRVLDVGTGTGTLAIELGRRGFAVTAVDATARAIERARARPGATHVDWRIGDALALDEQFDVLIDRGFLHALEPRARPAWAAAMARLSAPNGWLLVKTLSAGERQRGCHGFGVAELAALLGGAFELEEHWETVFQGPEPRPPRALFCLFHRRG
jgi:2-polyprenyl-3-methyl-5-hydroxy-6-metoxy-1,4-benzoquinol methylase/3-polyprenyl-4-hydroxybenzoate decarboxylase